MTEQELKTELEKETEGIKMCQFVKLHLDIAENNLINYALKRYLESLEIQYNSSCNIGDKKEDKEEIEFVKETLEKIPVR